MRVGQVGLADLFADRHHDAFPADHGAQPQCNRHRDLYPQRNKPRRIVDLLLEQLQLAAGVGVEVADLVLVHQANGFAGQVHVVTHVAHGFGGHFGQRAVTLDLGADTAGERGEGRDQLWRGLLAAHVVGQHSTRVGRCRQRRIFHQRLLGDFGDGGELQSLIGWHGAVQRIGHWQRADQNQHDQAHAFLAIVGTVGKRHAGAGHDQHAANPPRWRRVAFRRLVQRTILDEGAQGQQQQRGKTKADQRREQQRITDLGGLRPVHAAGAIAAMHQGIGHADANDRTDQRVRRRRRQAQPPGAEVPQNRGDQQGENHREPGGRTDLQNQLHRQQGDDAERHRAAGQQHPQEVEEPGPGHREIRRHRVGVNHRGHRVGGVVETVDELKAQRDQQRHAQQQKRRPGGDHRAEFAHVVHQAVRGEQQATGQHAEENHQGEQAGFLVELRSGAAGGRLGGGVGRSSHDGQS